MSKSEAHYKRLFHQLAIECGDICDKTVMGVIGFQIGGPVSMQRVGNGVGFVTVELSLYGEQKVSVEGIRFELFIRSGLCEETSRSLLTALGNLSMNATLGDGHTVDVSFLQNPEVQQVRLNLFTRVGWLKSRYGIYEVVRIS